MDIYLYQNNQQVGPFTEQAIRGMLASGTIKPSDLAWHSGLREWKPVNFIMAPPQPPPFKSPSLPPIPSTKNLVRCRACGNPLSKKAKACPKCGEPNKPKSNAGGCLGFGMLVIFGCAIVGALTKPSPVPVPTPVSNPAPPTAPTSPSPVALTESQTTSSPMPVVDNHTASAPLPTDQNPITPPTNATNDSTTNIAAPTPPALDPALIAKGESVYKKLKHNYPDAKMLPDHDLAPHTVNIEVTGALGGTAYMDLSMPDKVWVKLNQNDKDALVAFIQSKILDARVHPENYADIDPRAPAYPGQVQNIRQIQDNAWQIHTGKLDDEGYLNEDNLVLQGADYVRSARPIFVYADAKTDPVFNSAWDGSVRQVTEYFGKTFNDPNSIKYSDWTKVVKTGAGYQVSVTYRAKNAFGAYVLKDSTITFDKAGTVINVRDNQ